MESNEISFISPTESLNWFTHESLEFKLIQLLDPVLIDTLQV